MEEWQRVVLVKSANTFIKYGYSLDSKYINCVDYVHGRGTREDANPLNKEHVDPVSGLQ